MKLLTSAITLWLLSTGCGAVSADVDVFDDAYGHYGPSLLQRQKRSFVSAWTKVLKGARIIERENHRDVRWYVKYGGIEQARKDFVTLNPKGVNVLNEGLVGKVGNRVVHLYRQDSFIGLGILQKKPSATIPEKGFRVIQYIEKPEDIYKIPKHFL